MSQPTAKQFLGLGGGNSVGPTVKFHNIGDGAGGYIVEQPYTRPQQEFGKPGEIKKWKSGDIMHQLLIPLLTDVRDPNIEDDDGERMLIVNGDNKNMKDALKAAVQAAVPDGEALPGGYLSIWRSGGSGNTGDPYQFQAQYQPPTPQGLAIVAQHQAQKAAKEQPQQPSPQQQFFGGAPQQQTGAPTGIDFSRLQQPPQAQQFFGPAQPPAFAGPPASAQPPFATATAGSPPQQFTPPAQPSQPVAPPQPATPAAVPQYDEATKAAIRGSMTPDQVKAAGMDPAVIAAGMQPGSWPGYPG